MAQALIFPGQAAQFVGMGSKITNLRSKAKALINQADDILGYKLSEIMYQGPEELLKETKYTQPAVFVHSYIVYDAHKDSLSPSAVAGHSLGEITACVAAGVMSYEDGLRLVQVRAEAMQYACEHNPSTMAAILGLEDGIVESICNNIEGTVVAANYNCPGQLVISGTSEAIHQAIVAAKEAGARRALEIPVGGAFHSPLMEPAVEKFKTVIEGMDFNDANIPVYQNVNAMATQDAESIKTNLIAQITSPVRWTKSIQEMISDGVGEFVEVGGKGKVLMGMVRKISREVEIRQWQEEV
ncbi:MAG: [acyl-carrier-protein] S-malonyltransferase [Saprospiraceae bacterium]|jgi:[acyl-carrier-protein] S-malonyltransferase